MILADDSPLHRLPNGLPVKLVQMLDGIRYAISMADLSYTRLTGTLAFAFLEGEVRPHQLAAAAFLDAWSMTDSVNRLRVLLPLAIRQRVVPAVKVFLLATETIKTLRDSFQHADERVRDAAPFPMPGVPPLWGTLECLAPGQDRTKARSLSITPGTRTFRWANSAIADCPYPASPVDHIALTAFGVEVSLTRTHGHVAKLAAVLEGIVPTGATGMTFADLVMMADVPYDAGGGEQ